MTDYPDRPTTHETSPFAWIWDDLVKVPTDSSYVIYHEEGVNYYSATIHTNRGPVSLRVSGHNPPRWEKQASLFDFLNEDIIIGAIMRAVPQ
jgi:hypothetical protein